MHGECGDVNDIFESGYAVKYSSLIITKSCVIGESPECTRDIRVMIIA